MFNSSDMWHQVKEFLEIRQKSLWMGHFSGNIWGNSKVIHTSSHGYHIGKNPNHHIRKRCDWTVCWSWDGEVLLWWARLLRIWYLAICNIWTDVTCEADMFYDLESVWKLLAAAQEWAWKKSPHLHRLKTPLAILQVSIVEENREVEQNNTCNIQSSPWREMILSPSPLCREPLYKSWKRKVQVFARRNELDTRHKLDACMSKCIFITFQPAAPRAYPTADQDANHSG